ncbi:hypothetical protein ADUPG1_005194, partial [Aduncisulcus paluster]
MASFSLQSSALSPKTIRSSAYPRHDVGSCVPIALSKHKLKKMGDRGEPCGHPLYMVRCLPSTVMIGLMIFVRKDETVWWTEPNASVRSTEHATFPFQSSDLVLNTLNVCRDTHIVSFLAMIDDIRRRACPAMKSGRHLDGSSGSLSPPLSRRVAEMCLHCVGIWEDDRILLKRD